jgi:hypothetical protein
MLFAIEEEEHIFCFLLFKMRVGCNFNVAHGQERLHGRGEFGAES